MSEPTTLYQDGEMLIVTAPSEVQRLIDEGWSLTVQDEPETEEMPDVESAQPAKRGRKPKTV